MASQELSVGKSIPQRYDRLGFRTLTTAIKPSALLGLLAGKPGAGKTSLLATNPECFIINTDLSSVPVKSDQWKATFWPTLSENGEPLDATGKPIELTWDAVLQKRDAFLHMKAEGHPVPQMVAIDSIAGAISLIRDYLVKRAGKKQWRELDGRRAWDELNDELENLAHSFRSKGVGCYFTCHLVNATIPLGEERFVIQPEVTVSKSTWKRLVWQFELIAVVDAAHTTISHDIEQEAMVGGKMRKRTVTKTERVRQHVITTSREEHQGITKGRVELNDIALPAEDSWSHFETAYLAAASS